MPMHGKKWLVTYQLGYKQSMTVSIALLFTEMKPVILSTC